MRWLFLWLALALGTQLWLCFRVGRSSVPLAIATFFIGPPAAIYTLFKHRGDEETSITVPFVANLVFSVLFLVTAWQVVVPMLEAQELEEMGGATLSAAASAPASPGPAGATLAAGASVPEAAASAPDAPASVASAADVRDAVEVFSQALRSAGLNHTVTRLPASTTLPPGVTDAALFAIAPMGRATAAASAASGGGVGGGEDSELSVTLFKCDTANACRNLAGAHMQQEGPNKRRVLQNGLLLLSTPPVSADDTDLTPAAVASTFRKLQP